MIIVGVLIVYLKLFVGVLMLRYLCLFAHSGVLAYRILLLFCFSSSCCQFLWFVYLLLPVRYSLTFIVEVEVNTNDLYINLMRTGGDRKCSGRVSSSCSTSGTRRVNLVTNPVIRHE